MALHRVFTLGWSRLLSGFGKGHGGVLVIGAPNRHGFVVGLRTNPGAGEKQVIHFNSQLVVFGHLIVQAAAIAAVNVGKHRDPMFHLAISGETNTFTCSNAGQAIAAHHSFAELR